MHHVYILKCADDSYYVGMTINLERRLKEHQKGYRDSSYTSTRRPVELVWSGEMQTRADAIKVEHRIKGWTRAKKEALIRGERKGIHEIVKRERKTRGRGKKEFLTA
jgi:predicted GIY-YIG superfamily endonuclease